MIFFQSQLNPFEIIKRLMGLDKKHFPNTQQIQGVIVPRTPLLNLGCGSTIHSGWDNFDLVPCDPSVRAIDLLRPLPFEDASYKACYASHVLEHFPRSSVPGFLRETHRILQPGGVLRIVVPDLEEIVRRYLAELDASAAGVDGAVERHEWMCMELLDQMTRSFSGGFMGRLWYSRPLPSRELIQDRLGDEAARWIAKCDHEFSLGGQPLSQEQVYEVALPTPDQESEFRKSGEIHRWMYDRISLGRLLRQAGFQDARVCYATESQIEDFTSYFLDADQEGRVRKPDSLFMEAIR